MRGILDGHIVLDRTIAERGRFPAINILRSVSRTMPDCNTVSENAVVQKARRLLSVYENMAELIRLGAYRRGSDTAVDEAIEHYPSVEAFISQAMTDRSDLHGDYNRLTTSLESKVS